jgi:hypothetical protein
MQRSPLGNLLPLHLGRNKRFALPTSPARHPDIAVGSCWSRHTTRLPQRFDVRNHPDGNGIELYRDRDEAEWPRDPDGQVAMVTDPLDMAGLLAEAR